MKLLTNGLSALIVMLMCVSATVQAEIVHHEVCEPTLSSRGFTRECWENTETGKFYADADCTQELEGLALAKAVVYAKLPENPVTETNQFGVIEREHISAGAGGIAQDIDLNWAVSTTYNLTAWGRDPTARYAKFEVKEPMLGNARMVWFRNNKTSINGFYYVNITVNGSVVYSITTLLEYEGLFVVSLPILKKGDIVSFEVTQKTDAWLPGGPTFKASLEYNVIPCTHEYPEGSIICRLCDYIKAHDHTYHETEICSQCGHIDPTYTIMSGAVGKNNINDIKWVLNKYNVLIFTGTGEMESFNIEHNAWKNNKKDDVKKVIIGEGITKIADGEHSSESQNYFGSMGGLTEAILPSTLRSIGNSAFENSSLSVTTLPEGLETIGDYAFMSSKIENIVIPASVTTLGQHAFSNCSGLNSVTLMGAPTNISQYVFYNLEELKDFYLMSNEEISVADNVFISNSASLQNATLHVHNNLYDWALNTSPWNKFASFVYAYPSNVEYTDAENNTRGMYFDKEASDNTWTLTDGYKNLTIKEDIPMQTLTYKRNFSAANIWQALYVPFEMQPSDWADKFDVAAISNFHEYTDENGETEAIELEVRYLKSGKLLPNIPYLIRAKEAGTQSIVLNNVTLKKTEARSVSCSSTERRYSFTGTYDAIDGLLSKDYFYISGGKLSKATNDTGVLKSMRWYLTTEDRESMTYNPSAALSKPISIRLIDEDEATDITQIENGELKNGNSQPTDIYNLNGMRLSKPQKGINIINGKKVLVK